MPLGVVYTGGVQLGAHALERLGPRTRDRVLRRCSTNVDNLDAGRWETLLGSAFTIEEPMPLPYALLLVAVLGYAEYAYGAWWTASVFLFGHATATLLVYGALRRGADRETRRALDVGTSYGFNAVLGALTSALPRGPVRGAVRVGSWPWPPDRCSGADAPSPTSDTWSRWGSASPSPWPSIVLPG